MYSIIRTGYKLHLSKLTILTQLYSVECKLDKYGTTTFTFNEFIFSL